MRSRLPVLLLAIVLLVRCSVEVGQTEKTEDKNENLEIHGKTPKDFYGQFIYRQEGSSFRYLSNSTAKLSSNPQQLYVEIRLFLMNDHSYIAKYSELKKLEDIPGGSTYETVYEKTLSGQWQVVGLNLQLTGELSGRGTGFKYNDRDSVILKVEANINAAGLKETPIVFGFVTSTSGLAR